MWTGLETPALQGGPPLGRGNDITVGRLLASGPDGVKVLAYKSEKTFALGFHLVSRVNHLV